MSPGAVLTPSSVNRHALGTIGFPGTGRDGTEFRATIAACRGRLCARSRSLSRQGGNRLANQDVAGVPFERVTDDNAEIAALLQVRFEPLRRLGGRRKQQPARGLRVREQRQQLPR